MPHPTPELVCTLQLPEPGQRSPTIHLTGVSGEGIASVPTSEPDPHLPLPDHSVRSIAALDILEHVHDEQTWLAELARILVEGSELIVRVPLENPLAWIDALNIYRYVADTTGRGEPLKESIPLGWHRHYAPGDIPAILELAGYEIVETRGEGLPFGGAPHLAGLLIGNTLLQRPDAERRLFGLRSRWNPRGRLRLPTSVASRHVVRATRVGSGFDPDPDLDQSDRPEQDSPTPLE